MSITVDFPTRHTDAFAGTGYVHAGVLLALTDLAYAAFEEHVGISKPSHVVAVQRETRATYQAPLAWQEGASIEVETTEVTGRNFTQQFTVRSAQSGRMIATIIHLWAWLDTESGGALVAGLETHR